MGWYNHVSICFISPVLNFKFFFYSLLSTIIHADFRKAWNKLSFITPVCLPNPKLMSPHSIIQIWTCTSAKNNTVDFKNNCFKSRPTWFQGCCFFSLFIYGIFVHLSLKFLMHLFWIETQHLHIDFYESKYLWENRFISLSFEHYLNK